MNLMKNEKEFIKKENKLRMENAARLLADLIYLNYEHSNDKPININHIYKTLHDVVNYTKEEKKKYLKRLLYILELIMG